MNTKEYEDSEITFNHVVTFVDAAQVDPLGIFKTFIVYFVVIILLKSFSQDDSFG